MQTSIFYKEEDRYIFEKVERLAKTRRRSKSAMVLAILERYFEGEMKIGEILQDIKAVTAAELRESLRIQEQNHFKKHLGRIMLEQNFIDENQLERALGIQKASNNRGG